MFLSPQTDNGARGMCVRTCVYFTLYIATKYFRSAEAHATMLQAFLERNQPRQELRFFVKQLWHHSG